MKRRETYAQGFRLYPVSFLGHHVQGAGAAVAVLAGGPGAQIAAAIWTLLYIAYQGLTVIRKGDSAGLDVADYVAGFGVGIAGYTAWRMLL